MQKKENGDINNCRNTKKTLRNLRNTELKCFFLFVFFSDPPTVKVETSALEHLEDEKDSVTLRCKVDSNPVGAILWRKDGLEGIFSPEQEIVFSPVTRHTAGLYSCTAENQLGMSKPDFVELDVKCKLKYANFYYIYTFGNLPEISFRRLHGHLWFLSQF